MLTSTRVFKIGILFMVCIMVFGFSAASAQTLTIAKPDEPGSLDVRYETGNLSPMHVIMQSLLSYDQDFEYKPMLAEGFFFSDDGMAVTFELREGVKFHNGDPFTAKDVKFTIDWVIDPANAAHNRDLYATIDEVEIVDDYTVTVHLSEPYAFIVCNLVRLNILPQEYTQEVGDDFGEKPVGTGPFAFKEWEKGERITLEANRDYWDGAPHVDYLEFRFIPDDSSRLLAFRGGEVDIYHRGIIFEEVPRLDEDPNFNVHTTTGTGFNYIGFNFNADYVQERKVRQAISHLIDREGIIEYLLGGFGAPGVANIIPTAPWFNHELEPHAYDPEKARELLEQAGYGEGGFELDIYTHDPDTRVQIAELLQFELEALGIGLNIHVEDWGAFFERIYERDDYDMFILGWSGLVHPDLASYRQFHSEGDRVGYIQYNNPRMDELIERGRTVPPDSEESLEIFNELQEIVHEDLPYSILFYPQEVALSQAYIKGFEIHSLPFFNYREAHKFQIVE